MITETEESTPMSTESSSWCTKIFEYMKNRNRIGPGKIELEDCDFFIVGPRRTLRVLVPAPRGDVYYETTRAERPETIDENFVSRWASRPHPSGNCRCSFRQSKNRFSTSEERMISNEINRIRTSLCEAEKSGEDIEKLEQRISLNLDVITTDCTQIGTKTESGDKIIEIPTLLAVGNEHENNDKAIKNKIVKELELYIERLLHEVLNDTMKFFIDAGDTLKKSHEVLKRTRKCSCESVCIDPNHLQSCESFENVERPKVDEISLIVDKEEMIFIPPTNSFEINFAFHETEMEKSRNEKENNFVDLGYVNRGFSGTNNDPDSLDFVLQKPSNNEIENLDCTDSGINSVETMEFQTSQEPSLEESLMKIIDAKFGRTASKRNWKNLANSGTMENDEITKNDEIVKNDEKIVNEIEISEKNGENHISRCDEKETLEKNTSIIKTAEESKFESSEFNEHLNENFQGRSCDENFMELEETKDEPNFDKLRLELLETTNTTKKLNGMAALREKLTWKLANGCKNRENSDKTKNERPKSESSPIVELRIKNDKVWHEICESSFEGKVNDVEGDIVKYRKFRKPIIVFLHGFGSSAEIFENQLEYFSNLGYPCIAPELLGHGMSSAPDRSRDYHFDKLLQDLELVLQHYAFGAGRKCVLVAHNYGCSFATALACKYDSNIHQLVLISGGGPTPLAPPSNEGAGHCCLRALLTPLLMCGLHRDILYSARGRQHPYCGPEPIEQWPSHMKYVLDGMVWPEGDCVFHRRIIAPTLLIHGLRDDKVSLVQECQMERTIIKAFLDAIPTAGHTPMIDCPEQVNHMIHCFIDLWKRKKR